MSLHKYAWKNILLFREILTPTGHAHTHTHMSKVMQNKKCLGLWSFLAAPLEIFIERHNHIRNALEKEKFTVWMRSPLFIFWIQIMSIAWNLFVFSDLGFCVSCVWSRQFLLRTLGMCSFFVNKEKDVRINNKLKEIFMSSVGEEVVRCHVGI